MVRKHKIDNHLSAEHTNRSKGRKKRGIPGHETVLIANHIREHVRPTSGAFSRILALPNTNRTKLLR